MNRWIGIGNLGSDPATKFLPSGQAVANFSIAINEKWTNKEGEKQESTTWVRIVVFGKQAESCGTYLSKGRQVAVEGRMQTREYEKDGAKHYITEIVADRVEFLSDGKGKSRDEGPPQGLGGVKVGVADETSFP